MTKNRHELPRKKPGRDKKEEIAEDLPTLEPVTDDLPTLEPVADDLPVLEAIDEPVVETGPVKCTFGPANEAAFDTLLTLEVAAMDKKDVPAALEKALPAKLEAAKAQLRHRRVVVRCTGEGPIGTAAKDTIGKLGKVHVPLSLVIRRGFGDESLHTGKLPEVTATMADKDGALRVEVATGELDPQDLGIALQPHLAKLHGQAKGKRVVFAFTGKAKPDSALRTALADGLRAAGARRAAIGERVLFDLELADRVRVQAHGDALRVAITPADDDATTQEALAMVLPEHAAAAKGKSVRIELTRAAAAQAGAVDWAKKSGAARIEVAVANAAAEVVWPLLLTVAAGSDVVLKVVPNGRARAAVLAAFRTEAPTHTAATKGKPVVVDWPAGSPVDADTEAALREVAGALAAKSLACTVGGEQREPFLPEPVACTASGEGFVLRIDSEAGKPVELQRAVDRRLPSHVKAFRGKSVRVQVAGGVALSRTLLRSICNAIEAAGAMRLEVEEGGAVDVLLPAMLTIVKSAGDQVSVRALVDGRDQVQQVKAMQRELDAAALPNTAQVTVSASTAAEAVAVALMRKGAARVVLDGPAPVQIHPPLFATVEKKGSAARVAVTPVADAAIATRMLERELPGVFEKLGALATTTVTIAWTGADPANGPCQALVTALVGKKAAKVLLERAPGSSEQLHPVVPKPAPAPMASPAAAPATASAAAPAAPPVLMPAGALLAVLGRRDDAVPPMVVLGVAAGVDDAHLQALEAQLTANAPRFQGRAILVVPQTGGADVPVRKPDALVAMLSRVLSTSAAATLVFRGPDAQGRPHFQVLHSTLRAYRVGATFGDPRAR